MAKKILLGVVIAILFFAGVNISVAQTLDAENITVPYVSVSDLIILKQANNQIDGSFIVANDDPAIGNLFGMSYKIELTRVIDRGITEITDYFISTNRFSLASNESKTISFKYSFSGAVPSGNYKLVVTVIFPSDQTAGSAATPIAIDDTASYLTINTADCKVIKNNKEFFYRLGVLQEKGDVLIGKCVVKNNFKEKINALPSVTIKNYQQHLQVISSYQGEKVVFNPGEEKAIMVDLPLMDVPGAYDGELILFDGDRPVSIPVAFHWTVPGQTGKIVSAVFNKNSYKRGETVNIDVYYFGAPDTYWIANQAKDDFLIGKTVGSELADYYINIKVKDQTNEAVCASKQIQINSPSLTLFGYLNIENVVLDSDIQCDFPYVEINLGKQNIVYSTIVGSLRDYPKIGADWPKAEEFTQNKFISILIIFLLVAASIYLILEQKKKGKGRKMIIIFFLVVSAWQFAGYAKADSINFFDVPYFEKIKDNWWLITDQQSLTAKIEVLTDVFNSQLCSNANGGYLDTSHRARSIIQKWNSSLSQWENAGSWSAWNGQLCSSISNHESQKISADTVSDTYIDGLPEGKYRAKVQIQKNKQNTPCSSNKADPFNGLSWENSAILYHTFHMVKKGACHVVATPANGTAPLNNVSFNLFKDSGTCDTYVSGSQGMNWSLDCTNNGSWEKTGTTNQNSLSFKNVCNYLTAGTYTAKGQLSCDADTSNSGEAWYNMGCKVDIPVQETTTTLPQTTSILTTTSMPSTVTTVSYSCIGTTPTNASLCLGDNTGLSSNVAKSVVSSCTVATKCEYTCNSGYHKSGLKCVANSTTSVSTTSISSTVSTTSISGSTSTLIPSSATTSSIPKIRWIEVIPN